MSFSLFCRSLKCSVSICTNSSYMKLLQVSGNTILVFVRQKFFSCECFKLGLVKLVAFLGGKQLRIKDF